MRALRWVALASLVASACTSLNMAAPDGGAAGAGGAAAGAGGAGMAGEGGGAGTGGTTGGAGTGAGGAGGGGGTGGSGGAAGTGRGGTAGTGRGGTGGSGGIGGAVVEPAGLIAYWRFNEGSGTSVADSSSNGQPLTISTGSHWTTAGHQGAAFAFDGATDVASFMPQNDQQQLYNYPTIPLTFSAWVRPEATAASRPFATAVARSHEDYAFQDFWLGLVDGKPGCTIHAPDMQGPVAGAAVPANGWTHIACTYGLAGVVTLYVNGAYTASMSTNQLLGPIQTAILVGAAETAGLEHFFPGAIDDVRIYNTTLTASEVMSIAR